MAKNALAALLMVWVLGTPLALAAELPGPMDLWRDYDPDAGEWREEIVRQETRDGILQRDSYISAWVLGEEVRVYCRYSVKTGASGAPGLLDVHGWMGAPNPNRAFVADGWAVMAHDYCGRTGDRRDYTRYPEALRFGNMDAAYGPAVHDSTPDRQSITDPRRTSEYVWYAIQRRVLSYLARQPEVDRARLGASGYSYGGTLMWALGTDPRVKAIVPHFGIGWIEYYRNRGVWMYNVPAVEPPKTPGEELFLSCLAPEAYVPHITAATLFLNGSNDHHGGHERGLESFKRFAPGVPWAFAIQARGHHNTEQIEQNCKLWLDKYVRGVAIDWPAQPQAALSLDGEGVPRLTVRPAQPERVRKVEVYYALRNPVSFTRNWRDAVPTRADTAWTASLPVLNVDDYLFAYANVTYDSTIVLSTAFRAAIPARLGPAKATDKPATELTVGTGWTDVAALEGPGGVRAFRCVSNARGAGTEQIGDPKWQAAPGARLRLRFHCTEPQTLLLTAGDHWQVELPIPAADTWQELVVPASRLLNRFNAQPLAQWSAATKLHLAPGPGADLTKVLFAEVGWVEHD